MDFLGFDNCDNQLLQKKKNGIKKVYVTQLFIGAHVIDYTVYIYLHLES